MRELFGGAAAIVAGAFGLLLILLVIGAMYMVGFGLFSKETANFRGEVAVAEKVNANPNFRIAAYDHFYNLCASIQSNESTIRILEGQDTEEAKSALTANRIQRQQRINQYNADARKEGTSGQFRASDLPYQIDPNTEVTTCGA